MEICYILNSNVGKALRNLDAYDFYVHWEGAVNRPPLPRHHIELNEYFDTKEECDEYMNFIIGAVAHRYNSEETNAS